MKITVAALGLVLAGSAFADTTYYSEKESFTLIAEATGLTRDGSFEFNGKTVKHGVACKIRVTRKAGTLEIRPVAPSLGTGDVPVKLAQLPAFVSTEGPTALVYGSYEKGTLHGHYFIDRPGDPIIHGQFGVGFRLELEQNEDGKLVRIAVSKTEQMDLNYRPLGNVDCRQ